ncbi:ABC transporter permease, partial [bacterium]|nr:ABC transporter permease [bacterium]
NSIVSTPLLAKFAVRTMGRNVRRTFLSVIGVGVGCAIALTMTAFTMGSGEMRVRAIAESGYGHLRIVPADWERTRDNDLRLAGWEAELESALTIGGVRSATPHARTTALLAFGTRVLGLEMLGVDPEIEFATNRIIKMLSEGRYLKPSDRDAAVIGSAVADRLEVELDDDLLLTIVDESGEMEYAMLRIVGIVNTGVRDLDVSICHVTLEEMASLTGRQGAGEITLTLDDPNTLDIASARLRANVQDGNDVMTWKEILPDQGGDFESDKAFMDMLSGIVVVVVVLGIAGAQLTAILERRRELAVLIALGMKERQLIALVFVEAIVMGILGAIAGLAIALPFVHYTATTGIDLTSLMGGDFSISGVLLDPVMYSDMGMWMIPHAFLIGLVSMLIAGIYPAWFALRIDPTSALSLREA